MCLLSCCRIAKSQEELEQAEDMLMKMLFPCMERDPRKSETVEQQMLVESPSLEVVKMHFDRVLDNLI